ncbi:GntR family transcriptional regulator [Lentibacillus sp. N15]|uniref:GntR family transcriptional regulator n=1 Tax=Lentibacillus songyuanensis TaxID=3136161 RepID=UPI0031BA7396
MKLTQAEKVAMELKKDIIKGNLKPGQRLVQEEISHRLGVSRIPVKEGLKNLDAQGFIHLEPYKGATVKEISKKDIQETYYLRSILEGIACTQATVLLTKKAIDDLNGILSESEEALKTNNIEQFISISRNFHLYIINLSGYNRLKYLIDSLWTGIVPYTSPETLNEEGELSLSDHEYILERMINKDASGAENAMRMHIQRGGLHIVKSIL